MTLAARIERLPLTIDGPVALAHGLRFPDRDGVAIGDLLDIVDADGGTRRLARVVRREGGTVLAVWAGAFAAVTTGSVQTLTVAGVNATFQPGATAALIADQRLSVEPGGWLALAAGGDTLWLRVDRQDGLTFRGPAWREVTPALPAGPFTAKRLQLAVLARLGASGSASTGLGSGILDSSVTKQMEQLQAQIAALQGEKQSMASDGQRVMSAYQQENDQLRQQLAQRSSTPPAPVPAQMYGPMGQPNYRGPGAPMSAGEAAAAAGGGGAALGVPLTPRPPAPRGLGEGSGELKHALRVARRAPGT
jgi:hypothetical protein